MPFAHGFEISPWVERSLKVRQSSFAAYGVALLLVAVAVLVRGVAGQHIGIQQFTTFYPAVILAALLGGLWPGIFAAVLSIMAAWFFAQPSSHEIIEFVLFAIISGVDI